MFHVCAALFISLLLLRRQWSICIFLAISPPLPPPKEHHTATTLKLKPPKLLYWAILSPIKEAAAAVRRSNRTRRAKEEDDGKDIVYMRGDTLYDRDTENTLTLGSRKMYAATEAAATTAVIRFL